MAGEAKSTKFMLGSATIMLGRPADLHDFAPETHSIGLVKNFRIQGAPGYTDLTQGVKATKVFSVMTSNEITASAEVYEYTSKNLNYGLGLEGAPTGAAFSSTVSTATTANATSVTLASATGIAVGDYVAIDLGNDNVVVRRVTAKATEAITLNAPLKTVIPAQTPVTKVNSVNIGSKDDQPFLAAKVVGVLADGTKVTLLLPKVRITNGFSVGFTTENFDNMPFEFTFFDLVPSDPLYADFLGVQGRLLTSA